MLKTIVLKIIRFYQVFISPNLNRRCRFYPSCSSYAFSAVEKYGVVNGGLKGLKRLFRCHPLSPGGVDLP
ncbi:MAG: membrane protein insertion efficiency factor YidD [Candidatus Nealsonbacteria bacterium RIFCSPLOWO2_01_FULL_43_32]|uniref:Putative membrane protein insertion efficiency factor n=1 Tax=Candidatus Nealsonbacteria bacterium RIFCSPLOWO2_01_FULL_43_32 TaxID=1801672 RepID=A0A1G2EE31_9BACT|nr:MAG: membrane protein insertion efficiency factor YidD [Candidatus Nealsonbacteria bacterium RIFCSPLOWO2_01_FULL_43_32]